MVCVKRSCLIGLMLLSLAACAGSDSTPAKPTTGRDPAVAEVPNADETVRGNDDPPIVTLDLGTMLHEHRLSSGEDLPSKIIVPTTNLNAVPITTALQAILAGTDISLAWDTGSLNHRLVTVMNLSGSLPQVVQKICSAAKVFCSYRNGSLDVSDSETFIVGLPPTIKKSATTNSMVDTINQLIGGKAQIDDQGNNIIYTADYVHQGQVHQYLEHLRNGQPLVVLQLYVWEVTLNKQNAEGINWSQFNPGTFGPGFAKLALSSTSAFSSLASTSGGMSIGAVTSVKLNTNSLISFLGTQGRLQTISSPQVTFISGSSASLKIGGTQRYISQVGSNTSNVSGTSTTTGTSSSNISTDNIDTGLSIDVDGSYQNGVVFANLNLSLKNLVSLNPTTSGGLTIDLPSTTDEKVSTAIRVRPGDNLVMAGLVTSNDTNNQEGIPLGNMRLPTYGDEQLQNHELVIMVKPSIVLFSDKGLTAEAQTQKHDTGLLPNEAVVIDKNGSQTLTLPEAATDTAAKAVLDPVPESLLTAPKNALPDPLPSPPASGDAMVDQRLMQRGFSHAFDQLLQPPTTKGGVQ